MSASIVFYKKFTEDYLKDIYYKDVRYNSTPGIDRINKMSFEKKLLENIEIICRKVKNGTYTFSQYREKLLSRGQNKNPRVISIPTIRDKLTQKALLDVLKLVYSNDMPFLHKTVAEVSNITSSKSYDGFLQLDVADFYPSIKHNLLLKLIRKKIRKTELLHLIKNAIKQTTVARPEGKHIRKNIIGVPQGLSISNLLANIYMYPIDKKHSQSSSYKYFRYVDDILILCNFKELNIISKDITSDCAKIGLELHNKDEKKSKSSSGKIVEGFKFLGYDFNGSKISVRQKSLDNLRESLIKEFTRYKYSKSDLKQLKWSIDLRITGCIFNNTRYGWLFYFSQINDRAKLKSLDLFIRKQIKRFNLDPQKFETKKFIKTFYEIRKNMNKTHYIPDFDKMSIPEIRKKLINIYKLKQNKLDSLSDREIEYIFKNRIYRIVRQLEKDLAMAS